VRCEFIITAENAEIAEIFRLPYKGRIITLYVFINYKYNDEGIMRIEFSFLWSILRVLCDLCGE
jgi:hypothetical protein